MLVYVRSAIDRGGRIISCGNAQYPVGALIVEPAGIGHWLIGTVDFSRLGSLLTGSIPGIILGSLRSKKTPEGVLRPILAGTLALVGGKLLF